MEKNYSFIRPALDQAVDQLIESVASPLSKLPREIHISKSTPQEVYKLPLSKPTTLPEGVDGSFTSLLHLTTERVTLTNFDLRFSWNDIHSGIMHTPHRLYDALDLALVTTEALWQQAILSRSFKQSEEYRKLDALNHSRPQGTGISFLDTETDRMMIEAIITYRTVLALTCFIQDPLRRLEVMCQLFQNNSIDQEKWGQFSRLPNDASVIAMAANPFLGEHVAGKIIRNALNPKPEQGDQLLSNALLATIRYTYKNLGSNGGCSVAHSVFFEGRTPLTKMGLVMLDHISQIKDVIEDNKVRVTEFPTGWLQ